MIELPTTAIGARRVPRVWVGDRAFLARYGERLTGSAATDLLGAALEVSHLGICAGDEPSLRAALATERTDLAGRLLYHTPNLLDLERLDLRRCLGTLAAVAAGAPSAFERHRATPPLAAAELPAACTSAATIAGELARIRNARPAIVTAGGIWLDVLCAVGRHDEAQQVLRQLRDACAATGAAFAVLSYAGALVVPPVLLAGVADAVVIPLNLAGYSMLPRPEPALAWARSLEVPVIGIHLLDRGRIAVGPALAHAFRDGGVAAAVVGVGTAGHLDELVTAARATFASLTSSSR
jgi:hypothetical protein